MTLQEFIIKFAGSEELKLVEAPTELRKIYHIFKEAVETEKNLSRSILDSGVGRGGAPNTYDAAVKIAYKKSGLIGKTDPYGSQNNIDIGSTPIGNIEVKKITKMGGAFMLNDTPIKINTWYLFYIKSPYKLLLISSNDLPQSDPTALSEIKNYRDALHQQIVVERKDLLRLYGLGVYPRPNISMGSKMFKYIPSGIYIGKDNVMYVDENTC